MAETITSRLRRVSSPQNALLKQLRRALHRSECTEEGYCAIESTRIVEEAIRSGLKFRAVFFSESAVSSANRLLPQIGSQVETLLLPDKVFSGAADTESPQGVAALVRLPESSLEKMLARPEPVLLVSAGLQDPGNLGAMIRSAEAFGATGVLLGPGTVSPYNSKVIRASAGSLFRLPFAQTAIDTLLPQLRQRGVRLVATSSHKGVPLPAASLTGPLALLIGNEGAGVPRDLLAQMDTTVVVPHSPKVESLNAAVATSIVLYEIARQKLGAEKHPPQRHRDTENPNPEGSEA